MDEPQGRFIVNASERERFVRQISDILSSDGINDPITAFFRLQKGLESIFIEGYNKGFKQGVESVIVKSN